MDLVLGRTVRLPVGGWLPFALLSFVLAACGPPARMPKVQGESSRQELARYRVSQLGLQILPEGAIENFPDRGPALGGGSAPDFTGGEGDEVRFNRNLTFMSAAGATDARGKERPNYLVWHQDSLGTRILHSWFTRAVQDSHNRERFNPEPRKASFDPDTGRFFIPFRSLFEVESQDLDPAAQQRVFLDLDLANGSRLRFKLRMNVEGVRPEPKIRIIPIPLETDLPTFLGQGPRAGGWLIRREEVTNPTDRPMTLGLAQTADPVFSVFTYFDVPVYDQSIGKQVLDQHEEEAQFSRVNVRVVRLRTQEVQNAGQIGGAWKKIELQPRESVILEYEVSSGAYLSCLWPGSWKHRIVLGRQLLGGRITGKLNRVLALASVSKGGELGEPMLRSQNEDSKVDIRVGQGWGQNRRRLGCNGLYIF